MLTITAEHFEHMYVGCPSNACTTRFLVSDVGDKSVFIYTVPKTAFDLREADLTWPNKYTGVSRLIMPWPTHIVQKSYRLLDTEMSENKFYTWLRRSVSTVPYSLSKSNLLLIFPSHWHVKMQKTKCGVGSERYPIWSNSAIGRQLSYYEFDKAVGSITPNALPDSSTMMRHGAYGEMEYKYYGARGVW